MKQTVYTIVTRKGKTKVYRTETYLLLRRLKFIGTILAAIAVTLLMCGMSLADGSPTMPLEVVALLGMGILALALFICGYVSDSKKQENRENGKSKKR